MNEVGWSVDQGLKHIWKDDIEGVYTVGAIQSDGFDSICIFECIDDREFGYIKFVVFDMSMFLFVTGWASDLNGGQWEGFYHNNVD